MNIFLRLDQTLIARGLMHASHTRWERIAVRWTAFSIIAILTVLLVATVDAVIFDSFLNTALRKLGIVALSFFGVGLFLIVLSTNRLI